MKRSELPAEHKLDMMLSYRVLQGIFGFIPFLDGKGRVSRENLILTSGGEHVVST